MPFLKDLRYHRPSSAPPQTQCQKCLGYGHFTYECQKPRTYLYRPSRSQLVQHKKKPVTAIIDPATIPGNNSNNSSLQSPSVNVADTILEEKEKQRKQQNQKLPLPSITDSDSESETSSSNDDDDDTSSTSSSSYDSDSSYSSTSSTSSSSRRSNSRQKKRGGHRSPDSHKTKYRRT